MQELVCMPISRVDKNYVAMFLIGSKCCRSGHPGGAGAAKSSQYAYPLPHEVKLSPPSMPQA